MSLALLNRAVGDFEEFGLIRLDGAASGSKRDKRGRFGGKDSVWAAVDTVHEVLDRRGAQTDEAAEDFRCRLSHRNVQREAEVMDLTIILAHLLEELLTFLAQHLLVNHCRRRFLSHQRRTLLELLLMSG